MDIVETLTNRDTQIAALAAVGAAAAVFTVAQPFFERDKLAQRLKHVADHREALRDKQRAELNQKGPVQLRAQTQALGKGIVEELRLLELFDAESARKKLAQAGFRGQGPVFTFMFARIAMPFVVAACTAFYLWFVKDFGRDGNEKLLFTFGGFLAGFHLPNLWLSNAISKRQKILKINFPDALDLLLICVESGMSIEAAMMKVSEEMAASSPELAEEFGLTTAELSYLQERRQGYINLGERTGLDPIKAVCVALVQAERYGTPLGAALRVVADESRETRMQEAERKAAALPPKLTVPMIGFFLPVLFVVILGPAAMRVMKLV